MLAGVGIAIFTVSSRQDTKSPAASSTRSADAPRPAQTSSVRQPSRAESSAPAIPASCGPDITQALREGLEKLPPEPVTGLDWDGTPVGSNYDPCADLSTILVTVVGGTGGSPVQAMMFHRGTYLGTGTLQAYGLTSVNSSASTNDTVVLDYRSGQSCTACDDGVVTSVRYRWDGAKVQMLDPPPPQQ